MDGFLNLFLGFTNSAWTLNLASYCLVALALKDIIESLDERIRWDRLFYFMEQSQALKCFAYNPGVYRGHRLNTKNATKILWICLTAKKYYRESWSSPGAEIREIRYQTLSVKE